MLGLMLSPGAKVHDVEHPDLPVSVQAGNRTGAVSRDGVSTATDLLIATRRWQDATGQNVLVGDYGALSLNASGRWFYTLDLENEDVIAMDLDPENILTLSESFDVTLVDPDQATGATIDVTITV